MNLRQKITFFALLTIVLGSAAFAQPVDIPDPNLRAAVLETLDIADLPEVKLDASVLRRLTDLNAGDRGISDLTGLEHATSLTTLLLHNNDISDLRPLTPLVNLTSIRLHDNQINDISPLANLTKLTTLLLDRNNVTDTSPLANLTQLTTLVLGDNNIADIRPLANLTGLMHLVLNYNNLTDVTPLANLTNLKLLDLENNRIADITPLKNLTNLEHLYTHNNPIFDPDSPVVDIPDPNLRTAIQDELGHTGITQQTLRRLKGLHATGRNITNLTGLEFATNAEWLFIGNNEITDLAPLSQMAQLETLHIYSNPISDISSLSTLTNLKYIHAGGCEIADISALAKLSQLTEVNLTWNRITDITSLVNLSELKRLEIHNNPIVDYQILDGLSLDYVAYDESCDMPPLPLQPRLNNRSFPTVVSAFGGIGWSSILNQPHLSDMEQMAQHDLYFCCPIFNQYFLDTGDGWEIRGHLSDAIQIRDDYIKLNANMIFLVGVSMKEGTDSDFPPDSPYWVRNADGSRVPGWPGTYLVDFTHPDIQDRIVEQALAIARCGLYDGLFIDWWHEDVAVLADGLENWSEGYIGFDAEQKARDNILERIRSKVRSNFLILVNANRSIIPRTAPHINGSFMETLTPSHEFKHHGDEGVESALRQIKHSLLWLESNLREPRINSLEGWGFPNEPLDSPQNLRWMRAITTLGLTHSNGYVLFNNGIPGGNTGHDHYWYDFWDADLGRPVGEKGQLYQE
ncbi:MAG: leucine-rich repeat domain-containing protein, partial [Candidatus Poribacteria bacterium]|nr:leucine-rich repeat domain-containing protein [Candidatus Poribacteria bacterium]